MVRFDADEIFFRIVKAGRQHQAFAGRGLPLEFGALLDGFRNQSAGLAALADEVDLLVGHFDLAGLADLGSLDNKGMAFLITRQRVGDVQQTPIVEGRAYGRWLGSFRNPGVGLGSSQPVAASLEPPGLLRIESEDAAGERLGLRLIGERNDQSHLL